MSVLTMGAAGGDIQVDVEPASQSVDGQRIMAEGLGVNTMATAMVDQPLSSMTAMAQEFATSVNNANNSYNAFSQNSNSAVPSGFEVLTGQARPDNPPANNPGFDRDLCAGDVEC